MGAISRCYIVGHNIEGGGRSHKRRKSFILFVYQYSRDVILVLLLVVRFTIYPLYLYWYQMQRVNHFYFIPFFIDGEMGAVQPSPPFSLVDFRVESSRVEF